jgi:hypothetical protein
MRKPKDWGQPCPHPDCSHYRLINRGNMSAISTDMTQSGKRRIFRCSKCERPFSETRDTVFFALRSPEEKVLMALKMLLVKLCDANIPRLGWLCVRKMPPWKNTWIALRGVRNVSTEVA